MHTWCKPIAKLLLSNRPVSYGDKPPLRTAVERPRRGPADGIQQMMSISAACFHIRWLFNTSDWIAPAAAKFETDEKRPPYSSVGMDIGSLPSGRTWTRQDFSDSP